MTARFAAIVLTAPPPGCSGERGGAFVMIDGRESLLRAVDAFLNREAIAQVIAVFQKEHFDERKKKHGAHFGFAGVRVVSGGPQWIDQIAAALPLVPDDATNVIIHDAARPAIPYTDLEAILEAAEKHEAVSLITPVRSPLIELDEGGQPVGYRKAGEFAELLTPQVFSKVRLAKCVTDKAMPHASELHCVSGLAVNIRISCAGDAGLAKAMINQLPKPKIKAPSNPFEEAQW
ncbi:MAG: 2-C-methyl-D-erythritol 4-phosphate cytidylyltransferase [Phycisphaerae bacterium]|nr:2-C-methyl-D-erythritol 4-phosphate cytidylyltransferase [Phycisphaerae bacterium]